LAELQHQARVAERERVRAEREAAREHQRTLRELERAEREERRAQEQASRAAEKERKRLQKEAAAAHVEAMQAKVEEKNAGLVEIYDELENLLAATLGVDDYVDLETLRPVVEHPPFDRTDLENPVPKPKPVPNPEEPTYDEAPPPSGIFRRKKRHAEAVSAAKEAHEKKIFAWKAACRKAEQLRGEQLSKHATQDANRVKELEREQARYRGECETREKAAEERNAEIDELIANLGYGTPQAVEEYISIVLSNSVYPEHFEVEHEFEFKPETAELSLEVSIPAPSDFPVTKAFKYTKSSDEITSTESSQKVNRDRYASAVHQVALRSLHEVFEADRREIISAISLQVGSDTIDPATGNSGFIPFAAVAVERERFMSFNLAEVVPQATLDHLGAALSKNPFALTPADVSGIRAS